MQRFLYRQWCKKCESFTFHDKISKDEIEHPNYSACIFDENKDYTTICECGKQYENVLATDIPIDKIIEQQNRFKVSQHQSIADKLIGMTLLSMGGEDTSEKQNVIVVEDNAGYIEIMKRTHAENQEKKLEFMAHWKSVWAKRGRNEVCGCGSDKKKKYKKCCLDKMQKLYRYFDKL